MTLICSSIDRDGALTAISDVLTSAPRELAPEAVGNVPLAGGPLPRGRGSYAVARAEQKMVLFGQTMILWSGDLAIARAVVEHLRSITDNGINHLENLKEEILMLGLTLEELSRVSLIYHYHNKRHVLRDTYNVEVKPFHNSTVAHAGSGAWDFLEDRSFASVSSGLSDEAVFKHHWRARMASAIVDDLYESNLDFFYGGWFELAMSTDTSIRKTPYAIKFWGKYEHGLVNGPTLFSKYVDDHLCVISLRPNENGQIKLDMCRVRDFLRRKEAEFTPIVWDADFVIHLISAQGMPRFGVVIEDDPNRFKWEFSHDGSADLVMDEGLISRLQEDKPDGPEWVRFTTKKQSVAE